MPSDKMNNNMIDKILEQSKGPFADLLKQKKIAEDHFAEIRDKWTEMAAKEFNETMTVEERKVFDKEFNDLERDIDTTNTILMSIEKDLQVLSEKMETQN